MSKKESFWIPYADLMTVLMIVFLFLSIGYMAIVEEKSKEISIIVDEYGRAKEDLYQELNETFKEDFGKWSLELDKDLSIKFTNPDILFASGKAELTPKFQEVLIQFIPKYLNILLSDKYKDKIIEIRIEGHTDDVRINKTADDYVDNIALSQERSRYVLAFIRSLDYYKKLNPKDEELMRFLLTANGLSYGRTLDSNKQLTFESKNPIDRSNSRRVEFKIVTSAEKIVEEVQKHSK